MKYLIWSNQHTAWWRPDRRGYTQLIEEAGRYDLAVAEEIVAGATVDGRLTHRRTHPITGAEYSSLDEYLVLAPESNSETPEPSPTNSPPIPLSDEQAADTIDAMTVDELRSALKWLAGARPVEFASAVREIDVRRAATCGGGCES